MLLNQLRFKALSKVQHEAGGMMLIAAMGCVKDTPPWHDPCLILLVHQPSTIQEVRPLIGSSLGQAIEIPDHIFPAVMSKCVDRSVGGPVEHGVCRPKLKRPVVSSRGCKFPPGLQTGASPFGNGPPVRGVPPKQATEMPHGGRRVTVS